MNLYMTELTVPDWPAATAWYRDILGLEELMRDEVGRFALFKAGTGRIALKHGNVGPTAGVMLTFEVPNLAEAVDRLGAVGVVADEPITTSPEGYRRVIFCDPAGYRICLFEWVDGRRGELL